MAYAKGKYAIGECSRCSFKYLLNDLMEDGCVKGLIVCETCYDPPQEQERVPDLADPVALYKPAPEQLGGTVTITLPVYVVSSDAYAGRNEPVTSGTFTFAESFKCALYSALPTNYSTTNEITGSGYTAGGVAVTPTVNGTSVTFTDATWTSLSASFSYALVYRTSDNLKVAALNLGATYQARSQDTLVDFPSDFVRVI